MTLSTVHPEENFSKIIPQKNPPFSSEGGEGKSNNCKPYPDSIDIKA